MRRGADKGEKVSKRKAPRKLQKPDFSQDKPLTAQGIPWKADKPNPHPIPAFFVLQVFDGPELALTFGSPGPLGQTLEEISSQEASKT